MVSSGSETAPWEGPGGLARPPRRHSVRSHSLPAHLRPPPAPRVRCLRTDHVHPSPKTKGDALKQVIGQSAVRWVAVSFLLFAGLDLGIPSLCQAESILPLSADADKQSPGQHDPKPATPEQGPEEDCFCCCAHIRPRPVTRGMEPLAELSESPAVRPPSEPALRATSLFHPPRP